MACANVHSVVHYLASAPRPQPIFTPLHHLEIYERLGTSQPHVMFRKSDDMQGTYVVAVAGILDIVPFSDLDFGWQSADCNFCRSERAEERDQAEGIGKVEELHGCRVAIDG